MMNPPCICLIDDDIILLKALAAGLREAGYAVRTAPGAAAALDLMRRETIDAVVTDMKMPGTSGSQLIAQVRATQADLPIVAMSGASFVEGRSVVDTVRALGANDLLSKPFRVRALCDILDRVLAERASQLADGALDLSEPFAAISSGIGPLRRTGDAPRAAS